MISRGGAPGLGLQHHTAGDQRFNPLSLVAGRWPADSRRGRHRRRHRLEESLLGRGGDRRDRGWPRAAVQGSRHGQVRRRLIARRRDVRDLHLPDRPAAVPQAGRARLRSRSPAQGRTRSRSWRRRSRRAAPHAQVRTGQAQAQQEHKRHELASSRSFQHFLLAFGGIALFVGRFVIANTLSITIAQRTRELATLRTLGATRRQVRGSVMLEAFVIGLLASVVGLFSGSGSRKGLNALFSVARHRSAPDRARVRPRTVSSRCSSAS